ncbi:MAG TPA: hypothetical protein VIQ54_25090 [Polyangia bacterium]|jgi:hypothetical protein
MLLVFALLMQVQVRVTVPTVRFEVAPPMVEVQPGVLVVRDYGEEVFFVDGRYWMRGRDGRWYGANDYRGGWVVVEPRGVPGSIGGIPPGRYKHHKGKPEKFRVANRDGSVTEYKVKQKHGMTQVKVKEKGRKKGKWR